MRVRFMLVALLLALGGACGSDLLGPESPDVEAFVELLNGHRVSVGCPPLRWNPVVAVVAEVIAVTVVSAAILLLAYRPYSRALLWLAHEISSSRRALAGFMVAIGALPLALLAL